MANICDETVTIVTRTDTDMAYAMQRMLRNVLDGPYNHRFVTEDTLIAAADDMNKLFQIMRNSGNMNKLCFFAPEVDTRSESGFVYFPEHVNGLTIFSVDMGLKWGPSEQPLEFCKSLDRDKYGWCVTYSGEWCEWDNIDVYSSRKEVFIDGSDAANVIKSSVSGKRRSKTIHTMAYHAGISLILPDTYEYMNRDFEDYDE